MRCRTALRLGSWGLACAAFLALPFAQGTAADAVSPSPDNLPARDNSPARETSAPGSVTTGGDAAETSRNAATAPMSAGPRTVATRQNAFSLPFQIGKATRPEQEPIEIQLFVSVDAGRTWQSSATVRPDAQAINFQAPRDGEYWFFVRTKDIAGQIRPAGKPRPELHVIVDTRPPALHMQAERGEQGEVRVRWQAADQRLAAHTLRIEQRLAGSKDDIWRPIELPLADSVRHREVYVGEAAFATSGESLDIRGEIRDAADNLASFALHLPATDAVAQPALAPSAGGVRHAWAGTSGAGGSAGQADAVESRPGSALDTPGPTNLPTTQLLPVAPSSDRSSPDSSPTGTGTGEAGGAWPEGGNSQPDTSFFAPRTASRWPPDGERMHPLSRREGDAARGSDDKVLYPDPSGKHFQPPLQNLASAEAGARFLASQPRAWSVNTRRFEIAYDAGPSNSEPGGQPPQRAVEAWGSSDGGLTWRRLGVDVEGRGAVAVEVEGEGAYGFRLISQTRGGVVEFPPVRGDQPEVRIDVDLTPPAGQITRVEQLGVGGDVQIEWEAQDRLLARLPIRLQFRSRPDEPWQTLADNLENAGSYRWKARGDFPVQPPAALYFQLEIRDAAGNIGRSVTTIPVRLDWPQPASRIRAVRPVE